MKQYCVHVHKNNGGIFISFHWSQGLLPFTVRMQEFYSADFNEDTLDVIGSFEKEKRTSG